MDSAHGRRLHACNQVLLAAAKYDILNGKVIQQEIVDSYVGNMERRFHEHHSRGRLEMLHAAVSEVIHAPKM